MCHTALSVSVGVVRMCVIQLLVCLWWGAYVCHTALSVSVVGYVCVPYSLSVSVVGYVCVPYSS